MDDALFSGKLESPLNVPEMAPRLRLAAAICPPNGYVTLHLTPESCRELARWIDAQQGQSRVTDALPQTADLGDWPDLITVRTVRQWIWPDRPLHVQAVTYLAIAAIVYWVLV